jgi:PIN domain nuclease of toxin-antitoxin system
MKRPGEELMTFMDTNAVIWLAEGYQGLGPKARGAIERGLLEGKLAISSAVVYELHWLELRKRLPMFLTANAITRNLQNSGVTIVGVSAEAAQKAAEAPLPQGDPIDRMIVGTALAARGALITADKDIQDAALHCKVINARL